MSLTQELAPVGPQQGPVIVTTIIIVFIIIHPATLGKWGFIDYGRLLPAGL